MKRRLDSAELTEARPSQKPRRSTRLSDSRRAACEQETSCSQELTSNVQTPRSATQQSKSAHQAPRSGIQQPRSGQQRPSSNNRRLKSSDNGPRSNAQEPKSIQRRRSSVQGPRSNAQEPQSIQRRRAGTHEPTSNTEVLTLDTRNRRAGTQEPISNVQQPESDRRRRSSSHDPQTVTRGHNSSIQQSSLSIQEPSSADAEVEKENDQESRRADERDSSEEVSDTGTPVDNRIQQVIRKYNRGEIERDLWDTIHQLAYQHSQELSSSLVQWGRKGGIRDSRESHLNPKGKIFDPTANSFTLWPLPSELCPIPDWSLVDELAALITSVKRKISIQNGLDGSLEDPGSDSSLTEILLDQNRETLYKLFNNLYEYHPPHSSSIPVFTRARRMSRQTKDQDGSMKRPEEPTYQEEINFGLDWKFVLKVADSTLNLNPSILQRVHHRLCEIYRIPLEDSKLDKNYDRHRAMKSIVYHTPSDDSSVSDDQMQD